MENEQHHYQLRSRSRSRSCTPMIQNYPIVESEVTEHHYDLRNKSRERSHTPGEVTSSRRSGSRSLTGSSSKIHDKNMETIEESKEGSVMENITDNQSTKSESSTVTIRKVERRSERQRVKRQIFANGQSESKDNFIDPNIEQKRKSVTPPRILTSDYSSEDGERDDPPSRPGSAYEIYKQAGEWWNVFPKTDYTYSQTSQHRYEIAPGILAMPNMSRRSIHSDSCENSGIQQFSRENLSQTSHRTTESGISDTIDTVDLKDPNSLFRLPDDKYNMLHGYSSNSTARSTIYKKTHTEQYISHREIVYSEPGHSTEIRPRYFACSSTPSRYTDTYKYGTSQYDSDTELDEAFTLSIKNNQGWRIVQWFAYFVTFVTVWCKNIMEFFKFKKNRSQKYYGAQAYSSYNESKWNVLWNSLDHYSHNIYCFFIRILVLDTWLLSQFTRIRKWLQEKGPKIVWITLLPLLLLIGCWYAAQYLSLLPSVIITSEISTEKLLSHLQWNEHKSKDIKENADNNLIDRIEMLENGQMHQMEYLMNITWALESNKQSDIESREEYDEKIASMKNILDVNQLNNIVHNELKNIKHEFEKLREFYSELKSCCNANAQYVTKQNLEQHIEQSLFGYLPSGISKADVARIIQNVLASRNGEDQRALNDDVNSVNVHKSDDYVRKIVKEVLRIYDADKTGQVDYALESAGGQIISTRCTQKYDITSRAFSLFGFTLFYEGNNPRTVIQGNTIQPGACWAFQDFPGYLLIQLRSVIYVTGFTLEHVPKLILPNENMSSAPRNFNVWGLTSENDPEPVLFGDYEFAYSDDSLQYFPVQNAEIDRSFKYVELRIHSNHGQLEYTCLYRFRVHGRPT